MLALQPMLYDILTSTISAGEVRPGCVRAGTQGQKPPGELSREASMTRWWLGLVALGWGSGAFAQTPPPVVSTPAMPFNSVAAASGFPGTEPGMMPPGATYGPPGGAMPMMPPGGMPPGPGMDPAGSAFASLDNTDQHPNAFSDEPPTPPTRPAGSWYFGAGFVGLMRQRLGHGVIAQLDPGNNIPGFAFNADTGIPPPNTAPTVLSFNDVAPPFNWGTVTTLGYRIGAQSFELTGYYLGLSTGAKVAALPGQLDLPFSAFDPPLGFTGNNGLWLQADFVEAIQQTRIANAEFNYRRSYGPIFELIVGVRYMDVQEHFSILTDDDGIILPAPDPFAQAIYTVNTHNRIVAPQLGFTLTAPLANWLALSFETKGAWGLNVFSQDHLLLRGDGFVGPSSHINQDLFSHIYDLSLYATVYYGDNIRVRAGYQALWVVGVPVASKQVDFDPNNAFGRRDFNGSIFFHGPTVEIQFSF
jgi:hypothetical protein